MENNEKQDKAISYLKEQSLFLFNLQSDIVFLAEELNKLDAKRSEELYNRYSNMPDSDINKFRIEIFEIMKSGIKINKYALADAAEKYFENASFSIYKAFYDVLFGQKEQDMCREYLIFLADSIIKALNLKNNKYDIENFSVDSHICSISIYENRNFRPNSYFGIFNPQWGGYYHKKPEMECSISKGKLYYSYMDNVSEAESFEELTAFLSDRGSRHQHIETMLRSLSSRDKDKARYQKFWLIHAENAEPATNNKIAMPLPEEISFERLEKCGKKEDFISEYSKKEDSPEKNSLWNMAKEMISGNNRNGTQSLDSIWTFAKDLLPDDQVFLHNGKKIYAVGIITAGCFYNKGNVCVRVDWQRIREIETSVNIPEGNPAEIKRSDADKIAAEIKERSKLPRPWKWMMCVDKDLKLWHKCLQRGIVALRPGPCASYLRQRMQPGDIVYVKHKKNMVIARGIIQPGYEFIDEEELYTRKVEWTNLSELKFNEIIVYEPLSDITRHEKAVNILEELFAKADSSKIFENDILKEEQNQKLKKIADGHQFILLKGTSRSDKKIIADFLSFYIARHAEERRIERIQAGQSSAFDSYIAGNIDLGTFGINDPFMSLVEKAKNSPFMQYAAIAENINRSNAVVLIERVLSYFDKEMSEKILLKISEDALSHRPPIPANLHIIATIDTEDKNSVIAEKLLKNMFCVYECLENL